jgi:hypothetical protein
MFIKCLLMFRDTYIKNVDRGATLKKNYAKTNKTVKEN